jgi:outer membrane protein insertion porin family
LGNEGYTYAEVKAIPERDDAAHTVKVTFFVEPGHRAYVRRINFRGNTKTADEVLRREMRQMESASADSSKIEQSKVRLERLGYFKTVQPETTDVPGTGDQIDVDYVVEEQPSGSIGASVGFAQGSGVILGANVQQDNFLGTGKQVGVDVSTSAYSDQINFSYLDPYYTVDGVSRGFNVYYSTRDLQEVNVSDYSVDTYGIDMNFGYPLSEISRLGFGIGYANNHIKVGTAPAQEISGTPVLPDPNIPYVKYSDLDDCLDSGSAGTPCTTGNWANDGIKLVNPVYKGFLDRNGSTFNDIKLTGTWSQSTLNKARLASKGYSQSLAFETTAPGISDLEFWKGVYRGQYFKPLTDDFTLRFRGRFGYGDGYGGTDELPFFENFYGGGFGSVRGFKRNTLGPHGTPARAYAGTLLRNGQIAYISKAGELSAPLSYDGNDDPIGGNMIVDGSIELIFPMPLVKDKSSMQPSLFLDTGNVFDSSCGKVYGVDQINCTNFDLGELRYSTGIGLTWITGFGPLTFSIAKPLNAGDDDKEEVFQFSLGQSF